MQLVLERNLLLADFFLLFLKAFPSRFGVESGDTQSEKQLKPTLHVEQVPITQSWPTVPPESELCLNDGGKDKNILLKRRRPPVGPSSQM